MNLPAIFSWDTQAHEDLIECKRCHKFVQREDMDFSRDCHGITFRLVCYDCLDEIYNNPPYYDGEYYTELDECIDYDY